MNDSMAIYENFAQTKEIATALSNSDLVPPHFQKKPANVLIALEFAHRNNIAPFAAMQSMFVVHGRVGMSAAMAISLARKHNVWKKLVYTTTGSGNTLAVTAVATLHDDTEATATVSMFMANEAGWSKNAVYKSIPEQMLKYRAATFLIRAHFPEVLFGMQTVEEIDDVQAAKKVVQVPHQPVIDIPASVSAKEIIEQAAAIPPEPVAEEIVGTYDIIQNAEISDLKSQVIDFLNTRPSDWFSKLNKIKSNIMIVIDGCNDLTSMANMESTLIKLDEKYKEMVGVK
jgi:hypothetical protein